MNSTNPRPLWHCCVVFLVVISVTGCGPKRIPKASKSDAKAAAPSQKLPETVTRISDDEFRFAAYEGKLEIVRSAIESGTDVNAVDQEKSLTALHMAAYNGHSEVVKLLLEHGAKVDCRDVEGKTPLIHASTGPFATTVEILLAAGADVNAKESTEAFTPLMMGAGLGQTDVVKVLLRHKADRTLLDSDKESAIDHARNSGHREIVELLGP